MGSPESIYYKCNRESCCLSTTEELSGRSSGCQDQSSPGAVLRRGLEGVFNFKIHVLGVRTLVSTKFSASGRCSTVVVDLKRHVLGVRTSRDTRL